MLVEAVCYTLYIYLAFKVAKDFDRSIPAK
jgi:hypothetical protein